MLFIKFDSFINILEIDIQSFTYYINKKNIKLLLYVILIYFDVILEIFL